MPTLRQNFEGIPAGAAVTTANSGSGGNAVTPQLLNGAVTATDASPIAGTRSASCQRTGTGYAFLQYAVSGESRILQKARFRVAQPTVAESWMINRNTESVAISQLQMATSRKLNLVVTGTGTIYTLPTALTAGTDYDLYLSSDAGSSTTDGRVAMWVRDTAGNLAGGMTAPFESVGRNQGAGSNFALAQAGAISNNASTAPVIFDDWVVYLGIYAVGNVAPVAVPLASTLNAEPGQIVTLAGGSSADPDGTINSWTWTQVANGAPTVALVGVGPDRTFVVPARPTDVDYVFSLTVTGTSGTSAAATITITGMYATEQWRVGGQWVALLPYAGAGGSGIPGTTPPTPPPPAAEPVNIAMPTGPYTDPTTGRVFPLVWSENFDTDYPEGDQYWKVTDGKFPAANVAYRDKLWAYNPVKWDNDLQKMVLWMDNDKIAHYRNGSCMSTSGGKLRIKSRTMTFNELEQTWTLPVGATFFPDLPSYRGTFRRWEFRYQKLHTGSTRVFNSVFNQINSDKHPAFGELCFCENGPGGVFHRAAVPHSQVPFPATGFSDNDPHTYVNEWSLGPGGVPRWRAIIDGVTIFSTTDQVPTAEMALSLMFQCGAVGQPAADEVAEYLIDWMAIYIDPAGVA